MKPEEALGPERVDPRTQGEPQLPQLVLQALKENWSTPDVAKPRIVGSLLEPFFNNDVVLDKDGNQVLVPPNRALQLECAKTLKVLDQTQWERDNPKKAGEIKGGGASVTVNTGEYITALMAAVNKRKQIGQEPIEEQTAELSPEGVEHGSATMAAPVLRPVQPDHPTRAAGDPA